MLFVGDRLPAAFHENRTQSLEGRRGEKTARTSLWQENSNYSARVKRRGQLSCHWDSGLGTWQLWVAGAQDLGSPSLFVRNVSKWFCLPLDILLKDEEGKQLKQPLPLPRRLLNTTDGCIDGQPSGSLVKPVLCLGPGVNENKYLQTAEPHPAYFQQGVSPPRGLSHWVGLRGFLPS